MLFAYNDGPVRALSGIVAVSPRFRAGFPASVAAEPRPHGAYSREATYRKECA